MQLPNLRRFHEQYMMTIALTAMVLGLVFVYLSPVLLVTIPAGHVGVVWYRFQQGTDVNSILTEGTHLKLPWNEVYTYDARLQVVDQEYDAITKDGLLVQTTISFRFRINGNRAGLVHKHIGPDYLNVLLVPEIGSTARTLISQYTAEDFYTTYRLQVRDHILSEMRERLYKENTYSDEGIELIELEEIMLKSILLPDRVVAAIESKIEQYQRELEYDFRLKTESKEKERKRIEGEGVRLLFDKIGAHELPNYLRLAGINATLELARSPNTKIIVSGSSLNALPLLIGNESTASATPDKATKLSSQASKNAEPEKDSGNQILPPAPAPKTETSAAQSPKPDAQKDKDSANKTNKTPPDKAKTPPDKTNKR